MGENYLDMVPVIVIFFALGILLSRLGGVGGIVVRIKRAYIYKDLQGNIISDVCVNDESEYIADFVEYEHWCEDWVSKNNEDD